MPDATPIFPHLNAALNFTATLFLVAGWLFIRRRDFRAHGIAMIGATTISAAFLVSYLFYHANYPPVPYEGTGLWRVAYFAILVPHIILAAAMTPFIVWMIVLAARRRFDRHARLARWVWPVWVYVSITGVLVYLFLYVF